LRLGPLLGLCLIVRDLFHPRRVDVEDGAQLPLLRLGGRHLAPGGDVAIADGEGGAHAAVKAAAGEVEEPAPDVGGETRQLGDGGQFLGSVDVALRGEAFEVCAER
jgi:hypothetical protein